MTVIVVQLHAIDFTCQLKTPMGANKLAQGGADLVQIRPLRICARHGGQRVIHVEEARYLQGYVPMPFPMPGNIKAAVPLFVVNEVYGPPVAPLPHAEGDGMAFQPVQKRHNTLVVAVADRITVLRQQCEKLPKRGLNIVDVLKKIEVILLDIGNYGNRRPQVQKSSR